MTRRETRTLAIIWVGTAIALAIGQFVGDKPLPFVPIPMIILLNALFVTASTLAKR